MKVSYNAGEVSACSSLGNTFVVTFTYALGDLPNMIISTNGLFLNGSTPTVNVTESLKGTKEDEECSNRGICSK